MHEHPFRPNTRHYHPGGLEPHTHTRLHVIIDGVAAPTDVALDSLGRSDLLPIGPGQRPRGAGTYCEYPDRRRIITGWSHDKHAAGEPVQIVTRAYSPDGKWSVTARFRGYAGHGPQTGLHHALFEIYEHTWERCGPTTGRHCPTEADFADGEWAEQTDETGWVYCGEPDPSGIFGICRATTGEPRQR